MTALTPEQIEKWAGDKRAEAIYRGLLVFAKNGDGESNYTTAILHAHALHLQLQAENAEQQATIDRLRGLIEAHNRECENVCMGRDDCLTQYRDYGLRCPDCPLDYTIELEE